MQLPFYIREAEMRDIPAIAGLLDALNAFEGCAVETDPEALEGALFGQERAVNLCALVAEIAANVVGVVLYYPGYDTLSAQVGNHLADMVVAPAHRRRGIGRALVVALAEQTLNAGGAWVSLTALKQNADAKTFYLALGMQPVAVDFFAMGERGLAALVDWGG